MLSKTLFKVALIEPEIPSNTGNIGRSCVAGHSELHLIGPLGFEITDKKLKRAGLDYWPHLKHKLYNNFTEWEAQQDLNQAWFFSVKGKKSLYDCKLKKGDCLVFGKETKGLGPKLLNRFKQQTVFIPFPGQVRSLNLANAVSIALFEALRQNKVNSDSDRV